MDVNQQTLRVGQGNKSTSQRSHQHSAESRKSTKAESRGRVTNQPPKAGQMVDPRAYLWETKGSIQK
jgi:hypothetical protein